MVLLYETAIVFIVSRMVISQCGSMLDQIRSQTRVSVGSTTQASGCITHLSTESLLVPVPTLGRQAPRLSTTMVTPDYLNSVPLS